MDARYNKAPIITHSARWSPNLKVRYPGLTRLATNWQQRGHPLLRQIAWVNACGRASVCQGGQHIGSPPHRVVCMDRHQSGQTTIQHRHVMKHWYCNQIAWSLGFGVWGWYGTSPKWSETECSGCWLQFMHCAYLLSVSRYFRHRFGAQDWGSELGERKREKG